MRGHPREHLLQAWAGILQQQEGDGLQQPQSIEDLQHEAEALWSACAGATLVSCHTSDTDVYSRCTTSGSVVP